MHACMHTYVCVCVRMYVYACVYVYIYIYIHVIIFVQHTETPLQTGLACILIDLRLCFCISSILLRDLRNERLALRWAAASWA